VANTKERILDNTGELFRRYGYTGTGLKQIVANANAPFGSVYHFFPGGKEQLGEEVIRRSGRCTPRSWRPSSTPHPTR
jgi:AcrR family transcriptional regulator